MSRRCQADHIIRKIAAANRYSQLRQSVLKEAKERDIDMRTRTDHAAAARCLAAGLLVAALIGPQRAAADEGGVSLWLPGNFGSLAATPGAPGWSWATVYYLASVSAAAGQQ